MTKVFVEQPLASPGSANNLTEEQEQNFPRQSKKPFFAVQHVLCPDINWDLVLYSLFSTLYPPRVFHHHCTGQYCTLRTTRICTVYNIAEYLTKI